MKITNKITLFIVALTLLFSACDPIVERDVLENSTTVEGVELAATQATEGGNMVELKMTTSGVTGYWDYMIGKGLTDRITITFPVTGTFDFKYVGTLGAEFFEKSAIVTIDKLDHEVPSEWAALLGDDAVAGKTWEFAGDGGDGGLWWFMSPPEDPNNYMTVWWNAGGSGDMPPVDVNGTMTFDLDGAANYTYLADPEGTPEEGSFVLDVANQTLTVNGPNILGGGITEGYDIGNHDGVYQIMSLTEDELILYVPMNAWETGWTWIFRAADE